MLLIGIVVNIVVAITAPTFLYQSALPKVLMLTKRITPPVFITIVEANRKVVRLFSLAIELCFSIGANFLSINLVSQFKKVIAIGTIKNKD